MPRLFDFYAPLFSFGLELDASIAAAPPAPDLSAALQRAQALLARARESAQAGGQPAQRVESAAFAVVAWLDEVLGRHPQAPAAGAAASPLQTRLFNSNNAHSEFFHHLSALQAEDGELREVYWHALACGFRGQYYFEQGDGGELGKLKDLHGRQLPITPLTPEALAQTQITPQPYGQPDPPGPHDPARRERRLLRTGIAAALLIPIGLLLWQLLAPPHQAGATLAQRIEQQLQGYACADLAARIDPDGGTLVSGYVPTPDDIPRVQRDIAAMPGVSAAGVSLQVRPWPHCEVMAILKPYQARNRDGGFGLRVSNAGAHGGDATRLLEGMPVLLQVRTPRHESYLWVDYFTADGAVFHFQAGRDQPRLRAGETLTLGQDIPSSWLVNPPLGTVMVSALSSPQPFDSSAARPPFELASDYLLRLRETLAANRGGERLIADTLFLQTAER